MMEGKKEPDSTIQDLSCTVVVVGMVLLAHFDFPIEMDLNPVVDL